MNGAAGASVAAVAANTIAEAIKASGAIVRMEPDGFTSILSQNDSPLVVMAEVGLFSTKYQYLTSYKGLIFFTKSSYQLQLPENTELIKAQKIWIPE